MSTISLPNNPRSVNRCRKKIDSSINPEPVEIPALWRQAITMESLAPESLRGGLARARTRLLDSIPQWDLPRFLDQLEEVAL